MDFSGNDSKESAGKPHNECIAHGCWQYKVIDSCCWYHDQAAPQDWGAVSAGLNNHKKVLQFVALMLVSEGRLKLETKYGSLEAACKAAAEGLNDQALTPVADDIRTSGYHKDGTLLNVRHFDWYRYSHRIRQHLVDVFRRRKEVKGWMQLHEEAMA